MSSSYPLVSGTLEMALLEILEGRSPEAEPVSKEFPCDDSPDCATAEEETAKDPDPSGFRLSSAAHPAMEAQRVRNKKTAIDFFNGCTPPYSQIIQHIPYEKQRTSCGNNVAGVYSSSKVL
jgi:hypothetical protein